ncbi:hypothetical protein CTI16_05340 [Prevotella intermedia]|jgi:hypothetical protein|uniref:B3/B4 tRNA-binding domain-containing protein n=1 Tax=Prevotella intermedia TaxID=28131 RepID=A0AAJ3VA24_PREIN|nr:phenylalanine--tRNA ligase beta subunit-related protein [Prevotella intermedia]ATV38704.1 hypothetical protein CUB95_09270 [Prevotella intermedia]ATV54113.1 hypothetical protein CTM61_00900 [Prevotella intermedia]PIK18536.1 hypothetical protein CTI16_05340 [Prevotella intermedia]
MEIIVSNEIETVCPNFVGACVEARVKNSQYSQPLWDEINTLETKFKAELTTETLKDISGIAATRRIYRACGKDPSRYRPASEALIRRVLQGKALYQIDTLVDLINLASMAFGYSIGGFDADKFVGNTLTLGIGKEGEPYEGIGRGMINIHGLPVYRDEIGGVGTPTSDHERTKITIDTTHLLVLINGYDGNEASVRQNAEFIQQLLQKFCESDGGTYHIYK